MPVPSSQSAQTASDLVQVTPWNPGEDVIEVTRTPPPGPVRSTWRTFWPFLRSVTFCRFGLKSRLVAC